MLKGLKKFGQKPARVVTVSGAPRIGKFDEKSVLLLQSIKNQLKFPKGTSRSNVAIVDADNKVLPNIAMVVYPHYFDAELTLDTLIELNEGVANSMIEAGQTLLGSEIIAKIESGEFHKLMDADAKAELVASLDAEETYPIMSLIMKKELEFEIDKAAYDALDAETKAEYSYHKKEKNATLEGVLGKDAGFSCAGAYVELGGTCDAYADEACTEVVAPEDVDVKEEQFTKQIVLAVSEIIDFGGTEAYVAYTIDTITRKSKKGQVRTSTKTEEVAAPIEVAESQEDIDAPKTQVESDDFDV